MSFNGAVNHFRTITKHRHMVLLHCKKAGILNRGLVHDLSKYSPTEFLPGARFYQGNRSPNEAEREAYGYSAAWLHHKGRNKHHFEYWTDYNPETKQVQAVKMPLIFVIEMFCDRVAASKIYRGNKYTNKDPLDYFMGGKTRRLSGRLIHPKTSALLEKLLTMLAEKGEDRTFSYIRRKLLKRKDY